MKKLMIGLVGALAMVAGAEVESGNTVGYTQQDVAAGKFAMIGVQFTDVGNQSALSIQELVKGITGADYDDDFEYKNTAPQIQVWDGTKYEFYFYLNDAAIDADNFVPGWAAENGDYADISLNPGQAVWFKAASDCTITTAGQVFDASVASVLCPNMKFTMAANSKPIPLNFNNQNQVTYSGIIGVDYDDDFEYKNTAPQIQVWDGTKYEFYFYLNDAVIDADTFVSGWAAENGDYADAVVRVGGGFWVKATTGEFTINFAK